jgi:pilus assembly protein Flp/PilA
MHATQLPRRRDESRIMRLLNRIVADESGQDMIEYALIAALLGLSLATVLRNFSNDIKGDFTGIGNQLTNAVL